MIQNPPQKNQVNRTPQLVPIGTEVQKGVDIKIPFQNTVLHEEDNPKLIFTMNQLNQNLKNQDQIKDKSYTQNQLNQIQQSINQTQQIKTPRRIPIEVQKERQTQQDPIQKQQLEKRLAENKASKSYDDRPYQIIQAKEPMKASSFKIRSEDTPSWIDNPLNQEDRIKNLLLKGLDSKTQYEFIRPYLEKKIPMPVNITEKKFIQNVINKVQSGSERSRYDQYTLTGELPGKEWIPKDYWLIDQLVPKEWSNNIDEQKEQFLKTAFNNFKDVQEFLLPYQYGQLPMPSDPYDRAVIENLTKFANEEQKNESLDYAQQILQFIPGVSGIIPAARGQYKEAAINWGIDAATLGAAPLIKGLGKGAQAIVKLFSKGGIKTASKIAPKVEALITGLKGLEPELKMATVQKVFPELAEEEAISLIKESQNENLLLSQISDVLSEEQFKLANASMSSQLGEAIYKKGYQGLEQTLGQDTEQFLGQDLASQFAKEQEFLINIPLEEEAEYLLEKPFESAQSKSAFNLNAYLSVKQIGKDIVQKTSQIGKDIVQGTSQIGKDIVQGTSQIGKDIVQGTSQILNSKIIQVLKYPIVKLAWIQSGILDRNDPNIIIRQPTPEEIKNAEQSIQNEKFNQLKDKIEQKDMTIQQNLIPSQQTSSQQIPSQQTSSQQIPSQQTSQQEDKFYQKKLNQIKEFNEQFLVHHPSRKKLIEPQLQKKIFSQLHDPNQQSLKPILIQILSHIKRLELIK